MISLITISCIAAAFAPVVSKRLQADTIRAGSTAKLESNCSDLFGKDCKFCGDKCCYICDSNSTCQKDEYKSVCKCACVKCDAPKADGGYGEACTACNTSACTKCKTSDEASDGIGYYLKTDGTCAKCTGVKIFSDGVTCFSSCLDSLPNDTYFCRTVNGKQVKTACSAHYGTTCTRCDASKCKQCTNRYYWNGSQCVSCIGACEKCTNGTTCNECYSDHVKDHSNNTCPWACSNTTYGVQYCSYCTGNVTPVKCNICWAGYYPTNGGRTCSPCTAINKCMYCSTDGKCTKCQSGYYVNASGTCSVCTIANCAACAPDGKCASCVQGYDLSDDKSSCTQKNDKFTCSDSNFMRIGNLCVTRRNMGDSAVLTIPSTVSVVQASSEYCYTTVSHCCWKGDTTSNCSIQSGSYSGCNRTMCNPSAAKEICENFHYAGLKWRLPKPIETQKWGEYTYGLGDNGLMLCGGGGVEGQASSCHNAAKCLGNLAAGTMNQCCPNCVVEGGWMGGGTWNWTGNRAPSNIQLGQAGASSVRCVAEMDE